MYMSYHMRVQGRIFRAKCYIIVYIAFCARVLVPLYNIITPAVYNNLKCTCKSTKMENDKIFLFKCVWLRLADNMTLRLRPFAIVESVSMVGCQVWSRKIGTSLCYLAGQGTYLHRYILHCMGL